MTIDRRTALGAAVGLATTSLAGGAFAAGASRVRRAASSMTATSDDVAAFAEGVRLMKRRTDARSWAAQNRIHAERAQHGNRQFLPWHRLQVSHMERIIGQLTGHPRFAMPYWDWQEERYLPDWVLDPKSPLYEARRDPRVARLDFYTERWARNPDRERNGLATVTRDDFTTFFGTPRAAGRVEAYGHNIIHELVGGASGYMSSTRLAALDPIFWLHHCNIDRVWATWHAKFGDSAYPRDWKSTRTSGFTGADGRPTGQWETSRFLTTQALGYEYDAFYAPVVFAVAPGLASVPVGATQYRMRVEAQPGESVLRVQLPDEAVALLRHPTAEVKVEGHGVVAYERSENLVGRGIQTVIGTGSTGIDLGISPTFVHFGGEHAMHEPYALVFAIDDEVRQLAVDTSGPITIQSTALDLRPDQSRPPAQAVSLEVVITLTEYRAPRPALQDQ